MTDLTDAVVRDLQKWYAALPPDQAREARCAVRKCRNCLHFSGGEDIGACCVGDPRPSADKPSRGIWPRVWHDDRCGRWQDAAEPRQTFASPLSGVELARAFRALVPDGEV